MLPPPPVDARFFPRGDLDVAGRVHWAEGALEATLLNVSEGGALLRCPTPLPLECSIRLRFELPVTSYVLDLHATVVRTTPRDSEYEFGVRFDDVREADMAAIRSLVERTVPMAWDRGASLPRDVAVRFIPVIRRQAFRLVRRLPQHIALDDLVGAGFLGLVEAFTRFDPNRTAEFEGYALIRIRGAMLDELRGNDPVCRSMRRLKREVDAAAHRLEGDLGRQPDAEEIAGHLGLTIDDYRACLAAVSRGTTYSIDDDSDECHRARPLPPAASAPDPEEMLDAAQSMQRVRAATAALPPRLRQVLDLYYGEQLTLRAIGSVLGVTEARISQLVARAVGLVRTRLERTDGDDASPERPPTVALPRAVRAAP